MTNGIVYAVSRAAAGGEGFIADKNVQIFSPSLRR
jgi:hypothetical protein